jgi:CelD/BcsL family acetyltransferase involved in cellulose biosynthesis
MRTAVLMAKSFSRQGQDGDIVLRRYVAHWTTAGHLAEEGAAWRKLAEAAIEPNPLYGPNILVAMERHLRGGRPIPVLAVRDQLRNGALVGLAPLEARGWTTGVPGRAISLFTNPYISLSHPLIQRDGADSIFAEMLRVLEQEERGALIFPYLAEKRAFAALLKDIVARDERALARVDGWSRPAVEPEPGASGEQYARIYMRRNRRSNNDRRMRRLTDIGVVEFTDALASGAGGREAFAHFLALESAGWKGAAETALISKASTRAFAQAAFSGEDDAPRVRIRSLTLDGRAIAMALDLESQGVAYAFKAAYDPVYARHAPAMALDARTAMSIGEGFDVERLDSLAQTEIAQAGVWRQEEPIGRYVLALAAAPVHAENVARGLRLAAVAKRRGKQIARRGRDIVAGAVADRRVALTLALIGVGVPLASLLTRHPG